MDVAARATLCALVCFAACSASPAAFMRARTWAQGPLLALAHAGVPHVLAVQRLESRALTLVFDVTAFSVSVPFYGISLPLLALVRACAACVLHVHDARRSCTRVCTHAVQAGESQLVRKLSMLMTRAWLARTLARTHATHPHARHTRTHPYDDTRGARVLTARLRARLPACVARDQSSCGSATRQRTRSACPGRARCPRRDALDA
jgi:hypothetical protein